MAREGDDMERYVYLALVEKHAILHAEREKMDAELADLERSILRHEALMVAPRLGVRVMRKTLDKAVMWGSIAILLYRSGPLTTAEIRDKINPMMDNRQYATLRSHLFRMDLTGIIKTTDKKWNLVEKIIFDDSNNDTKTEIF